MGGSDGEDKEEIGGGTGGGKGRKGSWRKNAWREMGEGLKKRRREEGGVERDQRKSKRRKG